MALIPAKCPNCGGLIEVDNKNDAAVCKYCGTPFIIERAIQNFFQTYHITSSIINFYTNGASEQAFTIRGGVLEKYNGESVNVVIPNTVRVIGFRAFYGLSIEKIIFSNSVVEIQSSAFERCEALKEITIPSNIKTIGTNSFSFCTSLSKVILCEGVEEVARYAFQSCSHLEYFYVPSSIKIIGGYDDEREFHSAFGNTGCPSLKTVEFASRITADDRHKMQYWFMKTQWYDTCTAEGRKIIQSKQWKKEGKCPSCGSSSISFLTGRCKNCGAKVH